MTSYIFDYWGGVDTSTSNLFDPRADKWFYMPSKSASCVQSFLTDYSITDIWEFLHPLDREYSFYPNVQWTYCKTEYFLIDKNLTACTRSDHTHLVLLLNFPGTEGEMLMVQPLRYEFCYVYVRLSFICPKSQHKDLQSFEQSFVNLLTQTKNYWNFLAPNFTYWKGWYDGTFEIMICFSVCLCISLEVSLKS